jgi:hypothetical protein
MAGAGRGDSGQGGGSDDSDATTARLNALAQAKADGRFGSDSQPIVTSPATGWAGEQVVNPKVDDWEPAVATDPHSGYAYILTTRYGTGPTCQAHCPTPYIALTVSSNNGATWGKQVPLWGVKGSNAQYDPTIEVVPSTGVVYACFLDADRHNGFSLLFIKSTDHGKTWGNPVRPNGRVSWTDKDFLTTSPSGKDVYVSWNGPTGGDLWMGVSHDYGATWTQTRVVDSKRYSYAYDAKVLPDGTVIFSESSFQYTCLASRDHLARHRPHLAQPNRGEGADRRELPLCRMRRVLHRPNLRRYRRERQHRVRLRRTEHQPRSSDELRQDFDRRGPNLERTGGAIGPGRGLDGAKASRDRQRGLPRLVHADCPRGCHEARRHA